MLNFSNIQDSASNNLNFERESTLINEKEPPALKQASEDLEKQKILATKKIQSICREYLIKVKAEKATRYLLSYKLLEKAKFYVDTPSNLQGLPQASRGNTPVYLPNDLPIVLKHSGCPENQKRFEQMKQGHEICKRSDYKHLVIARARVYANFIIESRLPIHEYDTKEQIGLYIENREKFTPVVKEFVGFLFQSDLSDITDVCYFSGQSRTKDPYGTLAKTPVGRYDNIALYLEEGQGKIGLVDLGEFSPGCARVKDWPFLKCRDAIHLFPYHLEEIISEAKKFYPSIEIMYRKKLKEERDETLKRFKIAYEDHLDFIKTKGISFDNLVEIPKIELARQESIKEVITLFIRQEHESKWFYKGCLGKDPQNTILLFENAFPEILNIITDFLSDTLKNKHSNNRETISTYSQLLAFRTLLFKCNGHSDLIKQILSKLGMIQLKEWNKNEFVTLIIQEVFKELANGKEIAYYNPSFGYGGHAIECIFY